MARQLFVNPKDTTRLYLWDDREHWIDVKTRLSAKEEQKVQSAGIQHMLTRIQKEDEPPVDSDEMKFGVDMGALKQARASKYIVGWSFTRQNTAGDDVPVEVTDDAIGDLLPDVFKEIERVLDAFIAERDKEKKAPSGATMSA